MLSSKDLPEVGVAGLGLGDDFASQVEDPSEEAELVRKMALEQYNTLKGSNAEDELLLVSTFLQWEEILDVLDSGVMDAETMEIILQETGVTSHLMTFTQFQEAVDLVNSYTLAMDDEMEFGDEAFSREGFPSPEDEGGEEPNAQAMEEQLQAMLSALGVKKRGGS